MSKSNLTNESVFSKLKNKFGDSIGENQESFGLLTFEVSNNAIHSVIEYIKNDAELQINYLTNIGAVHYPENEGRELAVVYHIHSLVNNFRVRLKVYLSYLRLGAGS